MPRSSTPAPSGKVGRPATGRDPVVTTRIPAGMLAALDRWATERGLDRSEAVRQAIRALLGEPPLS